MKTKHKTILTVTAILFTISMHALGYFALSLFGAIFTNYTAVITETNWFVCYSILAIIPNIALGVMFYEDYT